MSITNVNTNGQVTIPSPIRKALGLNSGDPVEVTMTQQGRVMVTPVTVAAKDFSEIDGAIDGFVAEHPELMDRLADA